MQQAAQPAVVVAFARALTELVNVEKKNIVVLTEIARDSLRTEPAAAPQLATLITTRILQAAAPQKLPALYLLDSISKLVGEPYKTLFAASLPEAYMSAWTAGAPSLHRPLDKLLATWTGVYPQQVLADIQARVAAARAAAAPAHVQPPAAPNGYGGYAAPMPAAAPMAPAPLQQQPAFQPQPVGYGMQQPVGYDMQPPAPVPAPYQQPLQPQPQPYYQQPYGATVPAQQQPLQQPQDSVPDLLSSLMAAGLLAAPGAQPAAAPLSHSTPPYAPTHSTPPYAPAPATAAAALEREQPASTTFTPERLKALNPSAVARLLRQTEATKSRFLDRKFLRRQQKMAGAAACASRFWYLELDTWMASTVGAAPGVASTAAAAGGAAGAGRAGQTAAAAAAAVPQKHSVPVDDSQTHCALSGEQFEQFWDEEHQEWRYRNAKVLDAEEAASYGLQEGAIVLVSALGKPAAGTLRHAADLGGGAPGGGVLSELQARHEIAADLAAATAASAEEAGGDGKDIKPGLKHPLEEAQLAAEAGGEPVEKRQRVA